MRILLTLLSCLLLTPHAHADTAVYRWVDANGRVHYGDPASAPQGAQAIRPLGGANQQQASNPITSAFDESDPAVDEAACHRARTQLSTYQSAERIIESDALGQQREYSGEQREQLIARAEMAARTACEEARDREGGE